MRPSGAEQLPEDAALCTTISLELSGRGSLRGGGQGVGSSSQSTEGQGNCDGFEHGLCVPFVVGFVRAYSTLSIWFVKRNFKNFSLFLKVFAFQ